MRERLLGLGVLVGAAGLAMLALRWMTRKGGPRGGGSFSVEDREWLARIVLVEAHPSHILDEEGAGIAYVAWNRVRYGKYGSVRDVVAGGDGKAWFGAERTGGYLYLVGEGRRGGKTITEHPRYRQVLAMAEGVLRGEVSNPVGRRQHFYHPGGMRECEPGSSGSRWRCGQTHHGYRKVPLWGIAEADGGSAAYDPVRVGQAVFSGLLGP